MNADAAVLQRWWGDWLQRPGALPDGLQPVQSRLVRSVSRGTLPSGEVYVKLMAFPRGKDKLRYSVRPLPAAHEARMLAAVAALGVPCPEVVAVRCARAPLPRASMLVLRALPAATTPPLPPAQELHDRAALAARLLEGGILHPDLNAGNFVRLRDQRLAVLDLQSARRRSPDRCRRARVAVAARLLRDFGAEAGAAAGAALQQSGLLPDAGAVAAAARLAAAEQRAWLRGRVLRCLRESTEFTVRWRWRGMLYLRREYRGAMTRVRGGRELVEGWLGDRALQVMEGREPYLVGMFRTWPWLSGPCWAYIPQRFDETGFRSELMVLLAGFQKYRWLLRRGGQAEVTP